MAFDFDSEFRISSFVVLDDLDLDTPATAQDDPFDIGETLDHNWRFEPDATFDDHFGELNADGSMTFDASDIACAPRARYGASGLSCDDLLELWFKADANVTRARRSRKHAVDESQLALFS